MARNVGLSMTHMIFEYKIFNHWLSFGNLRSCPTERTKSRYPSSINPVNLPKQERREWRLFAR